jgi:hypothetical protein
VPGKFSFHWKGGGCTGRIRRSSRRPSSRGNRGARWSH